jgi:hypothetical protein
MSEQRTTKIIIMSFQPVARSIWEKVKEHRKRYLCQEINTYKTIGI